MKLLFLLTLLIINSALFSQTNLINIQGVLKDSNGNKVNGTFAMVFNFYDSEDSTTPVYAFTPSQKISVKDGLFHATIDLGSSEIFKNYKKLYLGVKIEDSPEFPKIPLVPVGYALHAKYSDVLLGAAEDLSCNGCVGTSDLEDGAVSGIKLEDGAVSDSKISDVSWSKITGIPADIADGDNDTKYQAGKGLILDETTFSLEEQYLSGEAYDARFVNSGEKNSISGEMIKTGVITFKHLGQNGCNSGEVIKYSSTGWFCAVDNTGINGEGKAGYIPKFVSAQKLDSSIIYENKGKIGIGTTEPTWHFQISGSTASKNGSMFLVDGEGKTTSDKRIAQISNGAGTEVVVMGSGNVGIGTIAPPDKFYVVDGRMVQEYKTKYQYPNTAGKWTAIGNQDISWHPDPKDYGILINWDTDQLKLALRDFGSDRKDAIIGIHGGNSDDNIRFQVNTDKDAMIIKGTGEVGIGTTAPSEKLEVSGNVKATNFIATGYPRMVGAKFASNKVSIGLVSSGWHPTPYTDSGSILELPITVYSTSDTFLVAVTQRMHLSSYCAQVWSGLEVINTFNNSTAQFIHLDGIQTSSGINDFGSSGMAYVSGLNPGKYLFRVKNWANCQVSRYFDSQRYIIVYRVK